jgi:phosphatidylserine/phosphatidylglycerophosphate/cardiolipin synthase-like enzyme
VQDQIISLLKVLKKLFEADGHYRLRVYYPALDGGHNSVYVHSTIMLVDDRLAIIGTAILNNRSMGFDSECNLGMLEKLEHTQTLPVDDAAIVPNHNLLDPEAPVEFDRIRDLFVQNENGQTKMQQMIKSTVVLLILFALAAAWRWTPLSEWINSENLAGKGHNR